MLNFAKEVYRQCIRVTRYHRKSESSLALGNTHGFHEIYARFFAEQQIKNFNPYFTVVGSFCFYFTFANTSKGEQSDEIQHNPKMTLLSKVARRTKPH